MASPKMIRRALEVQSRLFFYAPRGTKSRWVDHNRIPCLEIAPRSVQPGRVLLYFHGGGFVFGSPDTHSAMVAQLAMRVGARDVMPKYRLAPEAACPAALQDVRAAWDGLIAAGVAPADIVVGGDSAGGALAFGLIAALCAEGAAKPGAVFGFSPLTDMTFSGPSFIENADSDVLLPADRAVALAEMFLQGHPGDDPDVSPLFARFDGSPPAWITVGDTEILLDDARRLAAQMRSEGVQVQLVQEPDLPHVWPLFHNILPEARQTLNALAAWIRQQQGWES
ncbi:MAG: alpha/beta hydrolase [Sulfitobacter sp.]|nr:alpha/beta hydrolase [Sulfitobacter sp.]